MSKWLSTYLILKRTGCLLLFAFMAVIPSKAQVKFYAQVSEPTVYSNQTFQVQYIIEGASRIQQFTFPEFNGFSVEEVFEIPNTPKLNAKNLQLVDSYTKVAVLAPQRSGSFSIPAASALVDGNLLRSNSVKVVVRNSADDPLPVYPEVPDESEILPGQTIEEKIRENFFLTSEVNKRSCFVGEPIMAVYKACSRLNANSQVVKRPSLTGFSVLEMVDAYNSQAEIEMVRGKPYYVHLIRKVQLFPLQPGQYQLEGAEVESVINFVQRSGKGTAEDELSRILNKSPQMGGLRSVPHRLALSTTPLNITVKALPDSGQPDDFSGAVGNFTAEMSADQYTIEKGSSATIRLSISGTGNFPLITSPVIGWPANFTVTNKGIEENTNHMVYPLAGVKTFLYTISSTDLGEFTIPPIRFSYFDPRTETYKTSSTKALSLKVEKNKKVLREVLNQAITGSTILPGIPRQYIFFALIALAIVCWLIYLLIFARKRTVQYEAKNSMSPGSDQIQPNPFEEIDAAMVLGNRQEFYSKIQDLLWRTAAMKCGLSTSALNKQNLSSWLNQNNIKEEIIVAFRQVLEECEWALYTPETTAADMLILRQKAEKIYNELNTLK